MRVLVIGASGYVGSAVAKALAQRGHDVIALSRGTKDVPYESRQGDLADPGSLRKAASDVDAVVHAGSFAGDPAIDVAATTALLETLRTNGGTYVYTSGVWVHGATGPEAATEDAPTAAIPIVSYRPLLEQQIVGASGVRGIVIRPGIVYGHGGGIPSLLVNWARENGAGRYVGSPSTRWPMVHVGDLADLYVLAIEKATPGTIFHGVQEQAVSTVALAAAADRSAGGTGKAEPWARQDAAAVVGEPFAEALALDQVVSGERARKVLGWSPSRPGAVEDLAGL